MNKYRWLFLVLGVLLIGLSAPALACTIFSPGPTPYSDTNQPNPYNCQAFSNGHLIHYGAYYMPASQYYFVETSSDVPTDGVTVCQYDTDNPCQTCTYLGNVNGHNQYQCTCVTSGSRIHAKCGDGLTTATIGAPGQTPVVCNICGR